MTGRLSGHAAGDTVILIGEFFVSCFASFPGLVGGGAGEESVSGGFPAGSGVGQVADDQRGFFIAGVVGGADAGVVGARVLGAAVDDAGGAQGGEGDGVVAALPASGPLPQLRQLVRFVVV